MHKGLKLKNVIYKWGKIKKVNKINYLVISSTIDFSMELPCYRLMNNGDKYCRLNRDEFLKHKVVVDLQKRKVNTKIEDEELVWFRDTFMLLKDYTVHTFQ